MYSPANSIFPQSFPFATIILGLWVGIGMPVTLSAGVTACHKQFSGSSRTGPTCVH